MAEVVVAAADKEETPVPLDNPPHHPAAQVVRHPRRIADALAIRALRVIETEAPAILLLPEIPALPETRDPLETEATVAAEARLLQLVTKARAEIDAMAAEALLLQLETRVRHATDAIAVEAHPLQHETRVRHAIDAIAVEAHLLQPAIKAQAEIGEITAEAAILQQETLETRDLRETEAATPIPQSATKAPAEIVVATASLRLVTPVIKTPASVDLDATAAHLAPARRETAARRPETPDGAETATARPILVSEIQTSLREADRSTIQTTRISRT